MSGAFKEALRLAGLAERDARAFAVLCTHGPESDFRAADASAPLPVDDDILRRLTPYGVEFRYDDTAMPLIDATSAARAVDASLAWCSIQLKQGE